MGAQEIVSDRDEVHHVRAGAFSVTVAGMRGVTYFAQPGELTEREDG